MRLVKNSFLLMMAVPAIAGLAIIATAGTAQADIAWAAGAPSGTSGGSLSFTGAGTGTNGSDFLDTNIGGTGFLDGSYTVSMWLNTPDITRSQYAIGTDRESLHLGTQNSGLFQGHWGSDLQGSTNAGIADDQWFHATFTFEADGLGAGTATTFVNGSETDTAFINDPNRLQDIIIGARRGGSGNPIRDRWTGEIDDLAFFTSVVSDADIAALAGGTTDALALGANAYYDFEDDQLGTTAAAQVAAGATAIGAATLTAIPANAVPEPSSLALLACFGALGLARRKRS